MKTTYHSPTGQVLAFMSRRGGATDIEIRAALACQGAPPQLTRAAIELLTREGLLRHYPQGRPPLYQITPRGTRALVEAERMAELCPTIQGARR